MVYFPINIEEAVKKECKRRRYSEQTAKTYLYCINRFLSFTNKSIDKISKKDVRIFLEHLSEKEKAGNTMNVYHMAIRFLFEEVLDKRMWIDIKYSKVPEKLPVVLTKEEIKRLIANINNGKHKLMIAMLYSAGLRASELINLKIKDINLKEKYGFVRKGKGNKDRIFIIAEKIERTLIPICCGKNPENFLFLTNRNKKYNIRSLQKIIKKSAKLAQIKKTISCHTLRHSFATHLIEQGNSVSEVQSLLGHKSPETTMIYLHASAPTMLKIKSPFDE